MKPVWTAGLLAIAMGFLGTTAADHAGVRYDEVTPEVGVSFRLAGELHSSEENTWPAFPEVNGGGVCLADFDGDGLHDLYFVNQQYNPNNPVGAGWASKLDPTNRMFVNRGDGTFEDVTRSAGVESRRFGYACSAADYDGDGDSDLFVSNFGQSILYRNEGALAFRDVTAAAGMRKDCGAWPCNSLSSAWADYDLDGDLDLFVGNYVNTNLTDVLRGPSMHVAQLNWLYRNNADGTFTDVAPSAGVAGRATDRGGSKSMAVAWFDADLDGDLDLYVCNDAEPNEFYVNDGDGTFTDRSVEGHVADNRASMGIGTGDYDGDGYPDLFFTHYSGQTNGFYRNKGDLTFEDRSGEDDHANSFDLVSWGTAFADVDRDGAVDIVVMNGHTEWAVTDYAQKPQVFLNLPNGKPGADAWDRNWTEVTRHAGPGMNERRVNRGAAFGDYDYDGDTDVALVQNNNETGEVLRASGVSNRYLNVLLHQSGLNPNAIGARVVVEATGLLRQTREVQAGASYLSQNALTAEFGLGTVTSADRVTVHWPGGATTVLTNVPANLTILVNRGTGAYVTDPVTPLTRLVVSGLAGANGWWKSPVTATIAAADRGAPAPSGVVRTDFADGDGPWQTYDGRSFAFGEGTGRLYARSEDAAGNLEPRRYLPVRVDLTPPSARHDLAGTPGDNGWYVSANVTVSLVGADAGSGLDRLVYRLDGGAWTTYAAPFLVSDDAAHVLEYQAIDVAGNAGLVERALVKLDHTAPSLTITSPDVGNVYVGARRIADFITGPAYVIATPVPLVGVGGFVFPAAADATDATSGIARVDFVVDLRVIASDREGPAYGFPWDTRAHATGAHLFDAVARDAAGNEKSHRVRVVLLSGTVEGSDATVRAGPAMYLGAGPVGESGEEVAIPPDRSGPSDAVRRRPRRVRGRRGAHR